MLIKKLKIQNPPEYIQLHKVRKCLMEVALETINDLHISNKLNDAEFKFFQEYLRLQNRLFSSQRHQRFKNLELTKNIIIQAKRKKLFELWEKLEINDKNLTQLEQELDLEEAPMARADIR